MENPEVKKESFIMSLCMKIGMTKLAWSLRRLFVPVSKDALVLDVGSGGNPYPRANVILDAYEETVHRNYVPLVKDRVFVTGYMERLPFKDKSFDFIIASHAVEHTRDIDACLKELQRVGKAGYIETPDAFLEHINPYNSHRLEITDDKELLIIKNKTGPVPNEEIVRLYEKKIKKLKSWSRFISKNPFEFHIRYYWKEKIQYTVTNPGVSVNWPSPDTQKKAIGSSANIRTYIVALIRALFSQNRRNKRINILDILICPTCSSESLSSATDSIQCLQCGSNYPIRNGIPIMYPQKIQKPEKIG